MSRTLLDILADAGIPTARLKLAPGRSEKTTCPVCNGGRSREKSLSITVDADGGGVTWQCHRGNCAGCRGGGKLRDSDDNPRPREEPKREPPKPPRSFSAAAQQQRDPVYAWAEKRGISRETVDWFGLFMAEEIFFPQEQKRLPAIAFPYRWQGTVTGHKYRGVGKIHAQDPGTVPTLFNADSIEAPDVLIWVEGEPDVLACHEAGYRQIVSLRDGAPNVLRDEDDPRRQDDARFAALQTHADILKPVKKIILAGDADAPGMNLREELARRLGKRRCWTVEWPEGCKDAGDVLRDHGAERLRECIEAARPWPMKGMVQVDAARLRLHRERGRLVRAQTCGLSAQDEVLKMPVEGGRLIVVVGIPSHGKSSWTRDWIVRLAAKHKRHVVWASPEDGTVDLLAEKVAQIFSGGPFWPGRTQHMTDPEIEKAGRFISERFTFLATDDPDDEMSMDWVLERTDAAVERFGASLCVLDPWNEFDHLRSRNESETEYTGRTLKRLKAWGRARGVDFVIVVHPPKLQLDPKTKKHLMPTGYDVAGSSMWFNKCDLGLTVWRPHGATATEVHVWKARYAEWGKRGSYCSLQFNEMNGRFSSAGFQMGDAQIPRDPGEVPPPTEEEAGY